MSRSLRVAALAPWLLGAAPPEPSEGLPEPLDRASLVDAVLRANPTVEAARHAADAALAEVRGPTGADPEVVLGAAPLSLGSDHTGVSAAVTQRLDVAGRIQLERRAADAMADAAGADVERVRQELAASASVAWGEWWRLRAERALLDDHRALIRELGVSATGRYTVGQAPQSAPLRADALLADTDLEVLDADAEIAVAEATLVALLHAAPGTVLPAPADPAPPGELPAGSGERPDLRAMAHQTEAGELEVRATRREAVPELMVGTSYGTMWDHVPHRWMVEVGTEIPLHLRARHDAVDAASARLAERRSALDAATDQARLEADSSRRMAEAAAARWTLLQERMLPVARQRLEAARIAFETGAAGFDEVVDAERDLLDAEREGLRATAEFHQRRAELDLALGLLPGGDR